MGKFKLNKQLKHDCFILSESKQFILLLANNSLVPWLILVPKTNKKEVFDLDKVLQKKCLKKINQLSNFIQAEFKPDKINIATIGNVVSQLHIHIIGRYKKDPYWPGVVWGQELKKEYKQKDVALIKKKLKALIKP